MAGMSFSCPSCNARVRSPRELPDGTPVKCPGCAHVFRLGAADVALTVEEPPRPTPRRPEPILDAEPVAARVADDYDDDDRRRPRSRRRNDDYDDDDRPVRKKKQKQSSLLGRLAFLVFFLLILVGIVGGVVGYVWYTTFNTHKDAPSKNIANPPLPGAGLPGFLADAGITGFGGDIEPTGLNRPAAGGDAGPLTRDAAAALTEEPLAAHRPRRLTGPTPDRAGGNEAAVGANIPLPVIGKVKKATTMIVVKMATGGSSSGSGFFVDRDLVMTNAHVVGMLAANAAKPQRIDIVLNSGEPDEAVCPGEIVAVDRENDLALLRAGEPNRATPFPDPLAIGVSAQLFETQPVWVFGYPLGEQLGKTVTVGPTTVTSLRRDASGALERVQVAAAMEHGNSGGPVVDAGGAVIGVSVAIVKETRISFAVAAERVTALLEGRLTTLTTGDAEKKDDAYRLPVTIAVNDALKKVQAAAIDWWWGEPSESVAAARGVSASPAEGRQRVELKRSKGGFSGSITLGAELPAGKVLWIQARHRDAGGEELAYQGLATVVPGSAEPRPITLVYRPRPTGRLAVRSRSSTRFEVPGSGLHSVQFNLTGLTREELLGQDNDQSHVVQLSFEKLDTGLLVDDKPLDRSLSVLDFAEHVSKFRLMLRSDSAGNITAAKVSLAGVPPEPQRVVSGFIVQLARAVQLMSVGCPSGEISPGHTWTADRTINVNLPNDEREVRWTLRYTYRGVRQLDGREVADLRLTGTPAESGDDSSDPSSGSLHGRILVDLKTGAVAKADLAAQLSIANVSLLGDTGTGEASLEVKLQRE